MYTYIRLKIYMNRMYRNESYQHYGFIASSFRAQVNEKSYKIAETPSAPKTPEYDRPSKGRLFNGSFRLGVFGFRHLEWAECAVAPRQRDSIYRDNRQMGRKKKKYIYIYIFIFIMKSHLCFDVPKILQNIKRCSGNMCEMCQLTSFLHPISYTYGNSRSHYITDLLYLQKTITLNH